jgi:hypothetical protein
LISAFDTPVIVRRCSGTCRGVPSRAVNVNAFRRTVVSYPMSPDVVRALADELSTSNVSKGTIRFPIDARCPRRS